MGAPKIGYENFFRSGTVTVTSEFSSSFAKENAYDWNTYDAWKAAAAGTVYLTVDMGADDTADYFALAKHTLSDVSGTVTCQYSSDNFSADVNDVDSGTVTPTDNSPIFQAFTAATARYWRLKFVTTGDPASIGVATIGQALTLDRAVGSGFAIPYDARSDKVVNQTSEGGSFLGRSVIRQGISSQLTFTLQTLTFVRGNWRTFVDHAQLYPWFFSWNPTYDDPIFCWMEGNPSAPIYSSNTLLDVGVSIRGIRD